MKRHYGLAICLASLAAGAGAQEFAHKDWEVVCDNTLTCRIAGYSAGEESAGSVLLTRRAGPGEGLTGEVTLADMQSDTSLPEDTRLTLWIDGKSLGPLAEKKEGDWMLGEAQIAPLMSAVKGSGTVEFRGGPAPFVLSGDGAYAVFLKADDVQGRVGTPGALAKKGNRPESDVTPAVAAPVIQAARVAPAASRPLTAPEIAALKPRLLKTLTDTDGCEGLSGADSREQEAETAMTLTPLNDDRALIAAACWLGAYNGGMGYWVIDSRLAGEPVLVTDSGTDYEQGVISLSQKGRGLGDCWTSEAWVWDGEQFRRSDASETGMCRYVHAGGTWTLPTWVTDVTPAK